MKLKNFEIEQFCDLIFNLKLKGKDSRMRTRLLKTLTTYLKETLSIEKEELIKSYAEKDENGELVRSEDNTQVKLIESTISEFDKEYSTLMNEDFIIDENEANRDILTTVGNALLNCDLEFNGQEAMMFDSWCENFEEVIARYEIKEES